MGHGDLRFGHGGFLGRGVKKERRLWVLHRSTTMCSWRRRRHNRGLRAAAFTMSGPHRELFIQGITQDGRTFRPSDWAERLAGVMSCFRPPGSRARPGAHLTYSPYCVPRVINGVKCVIVNEALKEVEPQAWEFVLNFAKDNGLAVVDACLLPEDRDAPSGGA
jgi:hypothetical protein